MPKKIHLDGTTLEGGGQLLRISAGLAALTGQSLTITNIRGNRSGGGGLKRQHLTGVQWLSRASGSPTQGAEVKSKTLVFVAKDHDQASLKTVRGGWNKMESMIDIGTPGAIGLVLQAILPYILFAGATHGDEEVVHVTIKGGTNVSNSPSIDYIQRVLLPKLELIGLEGIEARLGKRGWSTGRMEIGSVNFAIRPLVKGTSLPAFNLIDRGEITKIEAVVIGARAAEKLAIRELVDAYGNKGLFSPDDVHFELSGHEKRLYVLLVAHTSTGLRLGRDHLFQERFSSLEHAVSKMIKAVVTDLAAEMEHGGCVDEYMLDQLAVYQALAEGRSVVDRGNAEISLHAKTAHWVANEMLGVEFDADGACAGVGWTVGQKWEKKREAADDLVHEMDELNIQDQS